MRYLLLLCCLVPSIAQAQIPDAGIRREQRDMGMQNFESANYQIDRRHQATFQRREMSGFINPSSGAPGKNAMEMQKYEEQMAKTKKNIGQTQADYAAFKSFPDSIRTGWHMVNVTDLKNFCDTFKVYVSGNRIERFIFDDWYEQPIDFTSDIAQGKTILQLQPLDTMPTFPMQVYFNDAVKHPARVVPPPQPSGSIALWTNMDVEKLGSSITVSIDGMPAGRVSETVQDGSTPDCKSDFVLSIPLRSGTYKMEAVSKKQKWKQTVVVGENACNTILLSK